MGYYLTKDELYHHGILGQKWGIRRYQNEDGTLTEAGKKRRQEYIDRESDLSNRKWDRRLHKSEKKLQKYNEKGLKALYKGNAKKYKKYDDKYINEQRKNIKLQAYKAIEFEKIKNMSLSDISKEKQKIGKEVISDILISSASVGLGAIMGLPYVPIFTPNVDNIKTNNRISPQERMNIEKSINSMPVADYNEEYQEPGKLKNIRK